jgi:hypothetical protein
MIRKKPGEKTVIDRDSFNITRPTLKDKGRAEDIEITERLKAVLQKYREIESNE